MRNSIVSGFFVADDYYFSNRENNLMIDYQKASESKLMTIVTEFKEYAYENVIVAICELRARSVEIPTASISSFL